MIAHYAPVLCFRLESFITPRTKNVTDFKKKIEICLLYYGFDCTETLFRYIFPLKFWNHKYKPQKRTSCYNIRMLVILSLRPHRNFTQCVLSTKFRTKNTRSKKIHRFQIVDSWWVVFMIYQCISFQINPYFDQGKNWFRCLNSIVKWALKNLFPKKYSFHVFLSEENTKN